MPVYLILAFCMLSQPEVCREIRPDMTDDFPLAGVAACQIVGERIAAEWVAEHPKWRLDRVRCRIGVPPREQET